MTAIGQLVPTTAWSGRVGRVPSPMAGYDELAGLTIK